MTRRPTRLARVGRVAVAALLVATGLACSDDDPGAAPATDVAATGGLTTPDDATNDTVDDSSDPPGSSSASTTTSTTTSTTDAPSDPPTEPSGSAADAPSDGERPAVCEPLAENVELDAAFEEILEPSASSDDLVPLIEQSIVDLDEAFATAEQLAPPDLVDDVATARSVTIFSNELFAERLAEVDTLLDLDFVEVSEAIVDEFGTETMLEGFTNVNAYSRPECGFATFE